LTWPQVNFKENIVTSDSQDTKTGRRRLIPMSQRLQVALLEAIRELPIVLGRLFSVMEFRVGHRAEAMEH
jgi:hypothetical protein